MGIEMTTDVHRGAGISISFSVKVVKCRTGSEA